MQLPPGLIRNLARAAGVHIWLDTDDALYTDGQYVGVHAARAGTKSLRLPRRYRVTDEHTGASVATVGNRVTVSMHRAETVLLRLDPED